MSFYQTQYDALLKEYDEAHELTPEDEHALEFEMQTLQLLIQEECEVTQDDQEWAERQIERYYDDYWNDVKEGNNGNRLQSSSTLRGAARRRAAPVRD